MDDTRFSMKFSVFFSESRIMCSEVFVLLVCKNIGNPFYIQTPQPKPPPHSYPVFTVSLF